MNSIHAMKRHIKIIGTGHALPKQCVSAESLDAKLGLKTGTSFKQTRIKQRYLSTTETAAQLAAKACTQALKNAELDWQDIDCLVACSATMDQALPYNAALIHAELGLDHLRTSTLDIGASCMSFLTALDTMSYLVEAKRYQNVMLVSSDIATYGLNWENLREGGIFGDGAAAAIIRASNHAEHSHILASKSITLSRGVTYCQVAAGGTRFHPKKDRYAFEELATFRMQGKPVFKIISQELPQFIDDLLNQAQCTLTDIDKVVPHQASQLALEHLAKRLNIKDNQLINIYENYGNQVGASLPNALHIGISSQRIQRGEKVLFIGTGAGLTIGGMILEY